MGSCFTTHNNSNNNSIQKHNSSNRVGITVTLIGKCENCIKIPKEETLGVDTQIPALITTPELEFLNVSKRPYTVLQIGGMKLDSEV